ncbi:MAG: nucleoside deaminase [Pseudomonadales bacterium]|nr:nucleoside deaminase [Pseudomonadales bacterium]
MPLTAKGVSIGNKVFGSAILRKDDLSLVIAGTNNETENPLWHGEVHTLKLFYEMENRPDTQDCIFLATHEPCSLCLSAITWTGFDNFYYFFKYEDTSKSFNIPHDLKILQEVFGIKNGEYQRENDFWVSHSLIEMIKNLPESERQVFEPKVENLLEVYGELSKTYQASKETTDIPLS